MRCAISVVCLVPFFLAVLPADTAAQLDLSWVYSPDSVQDPESPSCAYWQCGGLAVGRIIAHQPWLEQPAGIFGASAALPMEHNPEGFRIYVTEYHFFTYDAYVPGDYWDCMSATITNGNHYWNLDLSDPLTGDPDVEEILYLVGGLTRGGWETIAPDVGENTLFVPPNTADQYYLNLVLDTRAVPQYDTAHASHGFFQGVQVLAGDEAPPIPEPSTFVLLGIAVAGFIGYRRKLKK